MEAEIDIIYRLVISVVTTIFSRVHTILQPALSLGRSVDWSVTLYFFNDFIDLTEMVW